MKDPSGRDNGEGKRETFLIAGNWFVENEPHRMVWMVNLQAIQQAIYIRLAV